jgi:hypothetical protein
MRPLLRADRGALKETELPMSLTRRLFPGKVRFSALAGMFALPLLASCAYDDGYYDPSPGYGYGYGGYGGGYGGYGYGNPCWPYGCGGDWHHRRHHHQGSGDDDGDNNDGDNNHHHHHRGSGDMSGGRPPGAPGPQANDGPSPGKRPDPGRAPSSPYIWIPPTKDSKN